MHMELQRSQCRVCIFYIFLKAYCVMLNKQKKNTQNNGCGRKKCLKNINSLQLLVMTCIQNDNNIFV